MSLRSLAGQRVRSFDFGSVNVPFKMDTFFEPSLRMTAFKNGLRHWAWRAQFVSADANARAGEHPVASPQEFRSTFSSSILRAESACGTLREVYIGVMAGWRCLNPLCFVVHDLM